MIEHAHTPAMMNAAAAEIDKRDVDGLVAALVRLAEKRGAPAQAVFVMALCIVANKRLGDDAWFAVSQVAHSISMQGQERFALYGAKMYPFTEKQLAVVARAVLHAKGVRNDEWI